MKRALFVTTLGSGHLFFLKKMSEEDRLHFDAILESKFSGVVYYGADIINRFGEDHYLLDATGEVLKNVGHNVYFSSRLDSAEMPMEMIDITQKQKKDDLQTTKQ